MSFAALALRARAANDTTRAQINNIPSKSHVIPLTLVAAFLLNGGLYQMTLRGRFFLEDDGRADFHEKESA